MAFPPLDLAGFKRRSIMSGAEVDFIEQDSPGFIAEAIAQEIGWIYGRLRKRYGNAPPPQVVPNFVPGLPQVQGAFLSPGTSGGNSLPFGQTPPPLSWAGTSPPSASLAGRPILGSVEIAIKIPLGGASGVATFQVSIDNGLSYGTAQVTSATPYVIPGTGLALTWQTTPAPIWSADNVYSAPTPIPQIVLAWLTALVTLRAYRKRGVNPQDPQIDLVVKEADRARDEIKEAADSKDGLFDLPVNEDGDSAITTAGPLGTSDTSPYSWQDRQAQMGYAQDGCGGTGIGGSYGR